MLEHINQYVNYAERKFPEVLDRVIPWDRLLILDRHPGGLLLAEPAKRRSEHVRHL
jgi:hypothetical protein